MKAKSEESIRSLLLNGIGLHHAGLVPKYRLLVEQMAQCSGEAGR